MHYSLTILDISKVHLKFLKQVLGVRPQAPNSAILDELGIFPMGVYRKVRIIKFWYKIMKFPDSLLFKMMFLTDANGNVTNSWTRNVKKLLSDLGFGNLWNNFNVTNIKLNDIIQRIYDQQLQQWCSELNSFSK